MVDDWKPIPGFEQSYEISRSGEVRSLDRSIIGPKIVKRIKGKTLEQTWNGRCYRVTLFLEGRKLQRSVPALVAAVFGKHPEQKDLPEFTEIDASYAAGIIDGEGSIHVRMDKTYVKIGVQVGMVEPQVVDFLTEKFGGRVIIRQPRGRNIKPIYTWSLWCRKAAVFLRVVEPYLKIKGERARDAIVLAESAQPQGGKRQAISAAELANRREIALRIKRANFRGNGSLASYSDAFEARQ